jgi:pimeloyl-ACP methyl ester carboxylesterase
MPPSELEPRELTVEWDGVEIAAETMGEGPLAILAHGLTATRRYVLHGSKALARSGYRQVSYDARGHGASSPAPDPGAYGYPQLAADMGSVMDEAGGGPAVICGHSMGCHTAAAFALADPGRVAGLVLAAPVTLGLPPPEESLAYWDRLADGLAGGGVDGFMTAYEADLTVDPEWRERVLAITRERLSLHRHPQAVADALRAVSRSIPFEGMAELEALRVPALVVASHDEADPGHPYAIAEAWSEAIPGARLISEEEGKSPLAWQGGRFAREIGAFCEQPQVAERLA